MNILVDTNVLISAALRDRLPEKVVLRVATESGFRWIVTSEILAEYTQVLGRPKFGFAQETLLRWARLIEMRAITIPSPLIDDVSLPRDPKDTLFLVAAIASNADYLITGDLDLLESEISISTRIVSAAAFAASFGIK